MSFKNVPECIRYVTKGFSGVQGMPFSTDFRGVPGDCSFHIVQAIKKTNNILKICFIIIDGPKGVFRMFPESRNKRDPIQGASAAFQGISGVFKSVPSGFVSVLLRLRGFQGRFENVKGVFKGD